MSLDDRRKNAIASASDASDPVERRAVIVAWFSNSARQPEDHRAAVTGKIDAAVANVRRDPIAVTFQQFGEGSSFPSREFSGSS